MPEWLDAALPYIKNLGLASVLLLLAYGVATPLRRLYGVSDGSESGRPSRRPFAGVLLDHVIFAVLVLVPSILIVQWLPIEWLVEADNLADWSKYHQAWVTFWAVYLLVRVIEGVFVGAFIRLGKPCPLTRLNRGLFRSALMLVVAFVLIKYQAGKNISVLLTSTAIVTGVIGFAMQGVLGNLLAGMSLHTSRSMSLGDWIEAEGTIGKVFLVNWRETRIRTIGGHVVIIPNGKLAEMTIRNFSSPTSLRRHEVPIAASYGDAPGDVIEALLEAAADVPAVEKHPVPDAYVTGFKDFCIEYVLRFWSRQYEQQMIIEGEVMRMCWYKFQRRGIEIPFPMSGRLLEDFFEAVHVAKGFGKMPGTESEVESIVDDLMDSDFGRKLMADVEGVCMLSRDELRTVARNVKRTRFTHGEVLMSQNDDGESFYVLVKGTLKGSIANSDAAQNIEFELKPGTLFGEMSLLTGLPRSATITAQTNCDLLEFDRLAFTQLLALRDEIPEVLSDLAAARAKANAESLEKIKASAVVPPVLARDGIFHRLKRMVGQWRGRS